jgi:signal transduction histidine kinase
MTERTLSKILIVPTAVVVLILGGLLYRWSNEISKATTVRLADSLQMSMANWHLNLYRDFSDVAGALRVDSENSGNLNLYAQRFRDWTSSAHYRSLVTDFYVIKADLEPPRPLRLDAESNVFKNASWPSHLASLLSELRTAGTHLDDYSGPNFPRGLAGWKFDGTTPALVRPVDSDPGSWLVVLLDRNTIESKILPDLAKRYFMGVDSLDYLVAVVSAPSRGGQRKVIYTSDPGFGSTEVSDADGLMDVFGTVTSRRFGSSLYVFHELSAPAKLAGLTGSMGTQWFPLLSESANESWQLVVRHRRGGPLGAFVAEIHRRDLAISFGVLSVLVALISMLILTTQRANRLARLQVDFVTAISHELRSPLTVISSAAENIAHGVVGSKEQVSQYGKVIEGQTRRLSRLVEEVLMFAATRDERHRYTARPLEVSSIVDAALAATADLIGAAQFTVERDVPSDLPQVVGDLSALSQCLQNLITNALKYSGDQRWIGIKAGFFDNPVEAEAEVRISVEDRGIGIAPRDLPRIFEPFFRSSSATTAQIHGTGLGLALAKNIAEAMHGRLAVRSNAGRGTTFTLHLPVRAPAGVAEPARAL